MQAKKDVELNSLWQYKDKEGVLQEPTSLEKLIHLADTGLQAHDLEICQEKDQFFKLNDIYKIAKYNLNKKNQSNNHIKIRP